MAVRVRRSLIMVSCITSCFTSISLRFKSNVFNSIDRRWPCRLSARLGMSTAGGTGTAVGLQQPFLLVDEVGGGHGAQVWRGLVGSATRPILKLVLLEQTDERDERRVSGLGVEQAMVAVLACARSYRIIKLNSYCDI